MYYEIVGIYLVDLRQYRTDSLDIVFGLYRFDEIAKRGNVGEHGLFQRGIERRSLLGENFGGLLYVEPARRFVVELFFCQVERGLARGFCVGTPHFGRVLFQQFFDVGLRQRRRRQIRQLGYDILRGGDLAEYKQQ